MSELLARISDQPLNPAEVERAVDGPHHGAVVVFTGKVRDHDGGQSVSALEYSAHPQAEQFLRKVCEEVAQTSGLPGGPRAPAPRPANTPPPPRPPAGAPPPAPP
ncbi:molybdenum cofactor biosynthesis protein MoaE, partial [Nocardia tengchongensis]|uniref:molybdenum cofactor biosynthesis protein MoaE n=1 Tax=Nocardia tengchongensis TaxID=2055889 RepID=UPI0036CCE6B3